MGEQGPPVGLTTVEEIVKADKRFAIISINEGDFSRHGLDSYRLSEEFGQLLEKYKGQYLAVQLNGHMPTDSVMAAILLTEKRKRQEGSHVGVIIDFPERLGERRRFLERHSVGIYSTKEEFITRYMQLPGQ